MDCLPPGYVQRIGDERFPRFVVRDGLGQYWAGEGRRWSDEPADATLKEEGVVPVTLTGHCTPLAMYLALYEHPESVVFLDDCDAMFRNLPALGILRSALWEGDKGMPSGRNRDTSRAV